MALFGKKTTKTEKKDVAVKAKAPKAAKAIGIAPSGVVIRPHITEKAGILSQSGVYTFEIGKGASAQSVADAIEVLYKVAPIKVSITKIRSKAKNFRGIPGGRSAASKKAYVYLKKGDVIEFI